MPDFEDRIARLKAEVRRLLPDGPRKPDETLEGLASGPLGESVEEESVRRAVEAVFDDDATLSADDRFTLEAIVLPRVRPVIDVVNDDFALPPAEAPFPELADETVRARIRALLPAVGRIDDVASGRQVGTGFFVGPRLVMTNRHVAAEFCDAVGRRGLAFRPNAEAAIDTRCERDVVGERRCRIVEPALVHPYWDMALLRTSGDGPQPTPLILDARDPADLGARRIVVVGYPASDPRNDARVQREVFRGAFGVKRLQPGLLAGFAVVDSFGESVEALVHDCSTLGGNSGSPVIDLGTGRVVALHFAGKYLIGNWGVPVGRLALDPFVVEAGAKFFRTQSEDPTREPPVWLREWDAVESPADDAAARRGVAADSGADSRFAALSVAATVGGIRIPLEIHVRVGVPSPLGDAASADADAGREASVEPFHDEDYEGRAGYRSDFLGIEVPPPEARNPGTLSRLDDGGMLIPYEHFSVALHKERRLALFTASNVDARPEAKRPEPGTPTNRAALGGLKENDREKWFLDPRIPAAHQLPDRFFERDRSAFDKGHLVRREDVAWGETYEELRRANGDTYHVTNCSPQVAGFNRSTAGGLWGRLENEVLRQSWVERFCVFAGPVLAASDRVFEGADDCGRARVRIPRRYWKVVVSRDGAGLAAHAFVLKQDLADVRWTEAYAPAPAWRPHRVSIRDLEALIGALNFPGVVRRADRF